MAALNEGAAEGRTHEPPPLSGAMSRVALRDERTQWTPRMVAIGALLIAGEVALFTADALLPHGYNVANLYVIIVIATGVFRRPRLVTLAAFATIAQTVLAYWLKGAPSEVVPLSSIVFGRVVACTGIGLAATIAWIILDQARRGSELNSQLAATERERSEGQRMLAVASEIAPIGTWQLTTAGGVTWSPGVARILGFEGGEQPPTEFVIDAVIPEDKARLEGAMALGLDNGEPFREEVRIAARDGSLRWIVVLGERVTAPDDPMGVLHGTIQDVTRWREAEQSASALSHRLAQFAAIMPLIIWTADPQGRIEYFNEALTRYAGNDEGELLGDDWVEAVDPRDLDRVREAWSHSIRTGEPYDIEYRVRSKDDTFEWHHLNAQAERGEDGRIIRWWGTSVNVHGMRALRERADELAADREAILASMLDGVYALDHDWVITYVNASAERILGRRSEDAVGKRLWDLVSLSVDNALRAAMEAAMNERIPQHVLFHSERVDKWLDVSIAPSPSGVNAFFKDVTLERRLAEQLSQAQRLEAVGQLTGGIAHDFNNLLTVVLGGADALLAERDMSRDARETAALIAAAAERGAELTHRLLAFARRQPLQPRAVDLSERVSAMEPLLRRTLGDHIDLLVAISDTPAAEVDPGQFDNALLNMAINGRDAMPEGGRLTVEVAGVTLDDAYAAAHAEVTPGDYVKVTVADSGTGIAEEDRAHLFDPFFTTKEAGEGSGMGLAMVWGFIKQSNGHITVYSEMGVGTSFAMYLPLATGPATADGSPMNLPVGARGTGLVLVAEDDDLVRRFAADQLRAHGYEVIEAATGPDALALLDEVGSIDLLFTDVIMPGGMTGRHLADAVIARLPHVPVLYASGYTENVILHNGRLDVGVRLLEKPYSARQLTAAVAEALATQEGAP